MYFCKAVEAGWERRRKSSDWWLFQEHSLSRQTAQVSCPWTSFEAMFQTDQTVPMIVLSKINERLWKRCHVDVKWQIMLRVYTARDLSLYFIVIAITSQLLTCSFFSAFFIWNSSSGLMFLLPAEPVPMGCVSFCGPSSNWIWKSAWSPKR